jgi:hypothetical protein
MNETAIILVVYCPNDNLLCRLCGSQSTHKVQEKAINTVDTGSKGVRFPMNNPSIS